MFCILQHIANTTYCRNRLLLLQSLLQSTHRIHVQKHKYFKEKADMLFLQSFWICSTTAYPEKKIIETLKMQWYPGTRFRRKKKITIPLAVFPCPLFRRSQQQASPLFSCSYLQVSLCSHPFWSFSTWSEIVLTFNLLSSKDQSYITTWDNKYVFLRQCICIYCN